MRIKKKSILLIGLLAFILLSLGVNTAIAQEANYKDIDSSNADISYITYLSGKGIITGYPDGTFKPQEGLTRAQAAVVMVKAGNITIDQNSISSFKDVDPNHWACPYIAAAAKAGYFSGYPDATFKPDQRLTRAQGIALILKLSQQPQTARLPQLKDLNDQHWAAKAVATGLAAGMVGLSSDNQNYYPEGPFSRVNMTLALGILLTEDPILSASILPGKLRPIEGKTKIQKADSSEIELKETTTVNMGDTITTEKGASAELSYPDGSSMLIKEDTQIHIKEAKGRKYIKTNGQEGIAVDWLNLNMKKGTMFTGLATKHETSDSTTPTTKPISSKNQTIAGLDGREYVAAATQENQDMPWYEASKAKKVKIRVDMPWGIAAVRGTFILISISPSGQAKVSCLNGDAQISNAGQSVSLSQNQSTQIIQETAVPSQTASIPPETVKLFEQVVTWIQETAQTMEKNNEQTAPPPPPALIAQLKDVLTPVQQTPEQNQTQPANESKPAQTQSTQGVNNAVTALQAINQALGSIGINTGSNSVVFQTNESTNSNNKPASTGGSSNGGSSVPTPPQYRYIYTGSGITITTSENHQLTGSELQQQTSSDGSTWGTTVNGNIVDFSFSSSDTNVATVDNSGKITAAGAGNCNIIAKYREIDAENTKVIIPITVTLPSSEKLITAATAGTLVNGYITAVAIPPGTKVSALKTGLTVSAYATNEILTLSGGASAADDADVTAAMVIQVTAQDGSKAEYKIFDKAITTLEDLNAINNNLSDKYILARNLNFTDSASYASNTVNTAWTTGAGWEPIGTLTNPFAGTFDGNGKTISGLFMNKSTQFVGLFGGSSGNISNLGLLNSDVTGADFTGSLVGHNSGNIANCYAAGTVNGTQQVGGLVGRNTDNGTIENCYASALVNVTGTDEFFHSGGLVGDSNGIIKNCHATGNVTGKSRTGGLLGCGKGTIENCYATGNVTGTEGVGGLFGVNWSAAVTKCYATGSVSGTGSINCHIGGLLGYNAGSITESYAMTGEVTGNTEVGGLVGDNAGGSITNSYATGKVIGTTNVGGLVARNYFNESSNSAPSNTNCYATGQVTGTTNVGGLVGVTSHNPSNSYYNSETTGQSDTGKGTPLTTSELKMLTTFSGWDFTATTGVWKITENVTYPLLQWQP